MAVKQFTEMTEKELEYELSRITGGIAASKRRGAMLQLEHDRLSHDLAQSKNYKNILEQDLDSVERELRIRKSVQ